MFWVTRQSQLTSEQEAQNRAAMRTAYTAIVAALLGKTPARVVSDYFSVLGLVATDENILHTIEQRRIPYQDLEQAVTYAQAAKEAMDRGDLVAAERQFTKSGHHLTAYVAMIDKHGSGAFGQTGFKDLVQTVTIGLPTIRDALEEGYLKQDIHTEGLEGAVGMINLIKKRGY